VWFCLEEEGRVVLVLDEKVVAGSVLTATAVSIGVAVLAGRKKSRPGSINWKRIANIPTDRLCRDLVFRPRPRPRQDRVRQHIWRHQNPINQMCLNKVVQSAYILAV
jgi:hypothetical protein